MALVHRLPPALQHRDFRLYFLGSIATTAGSQFTTVAMAWQMYELTHSAFMLAMLGLTRAIPQIALALVGGVLADAMDRRKFMVSMQLLQAAASLWLAALAFTGTITPVALIIGNLAFAVGSAIETPARQAVVVNLVPRSDFTSAVALNNVGRNASPAVGSSLAGALLAFAGPSWCYLVDGASWFALIGVLLTIRSALQSERRSSISLRAVAEGVRFVRGQSVVLSFMVLDFGATFFGTANSLLPIYASDILHVGPVGLGLMFAAPSVGQVTTGVIMGSTRRIRKAGKWVLLGVGLYGICICGFAISPYFPLSLLLLAGTGVGNGVSAVLRSTSNNLLTPDDLRGRVAAVNSVFTGGGPQLGQFEGGMVAEAFGATVSAFTGGLGVLALVAAIALVPEVRRFDLTAAIHAITEPPPRPESEPQPRR